VLAEVCLVAAVPGEDSTFTTLDLNQSRSVSGPSYIGGHIFLLVASPSYLFIVDDEGDGNLGIVGPLQALKTLLTVALEVSGEAVVWVRRVCFRHPLLFQRKREDIWRES
jgi:hypothetical protein